MLKPSSNSTVPPQNAIRVVSLDGKIIISTWNPLDESGRVRFRLTSVVARGAVSRTGSMTYKHQNE